MSQTSIEYFSDLLDNLADFYSQKNKRKISRHEIFDALLLLLSDSYDLELNIDLWDIHLSKPEAKRALKDFDFETLSRTIDYSDTIFPYNVLFYKKVRIKNNGLTWIVHKYDKDPFPSIPHAHCLDQNLKLNLINGKYYRNRKYKGKIYKKDLLLIRQKIELIYKEKLPDICYNNN